MKIKGNYGYLKYKKLQQTVKTMIFFAIALAIFVIGYAATGNRKNIGTILAVLGVLPASKEAVTMIMYMRFRTVQESLYQNGSKFEKSATILYDLIFTSSQNAMKLDCIVICNHSIIAYTEQKKLSESDTEKYLKNFLSNQGKGTVSIKIFKELQPFLDGLKSLQLHNNNRDDNAIAFENKIKELLIDFSM